MRNLHKLLIVLISVVFIASGAMAQISDASPKANSQKEMKVKPDKPYDNYQGMGSAEIAPTIQEFNSVQLELLEKSGITEKDMETKEGTAKAYDILKNKEASMAYKSYPKQSSFSSVPIKGTDDVVTVTLGIETNVSTGTNDTPFGTFYEDGQNQYLFSASELAIAGLGAGDITEVGWEVVSADAALMEGFNIEVKHTTATSVTAFEDGFTNVYSGSHTAVAGWNMFTFTSPFTYDGTSNLLVKICFDNAGYTSNSSVYYSNTAVEMNGWAYNDGTAGCTDPYEGSLLTRPNTRITGEENLAAPPGFPFDEIPISGAFDIPIDGDLTWTFGNNSETYDLWFGLAGDMQLVVDGGNAAGPGEYTYTGLEYASNYEWQVVAHNANGTTNSSVWNFVTECAIVTAPYFEDFSIWPPICWDLTGGTNEWVHYIAAECAEASFWNQTAGNNDVMTTGEIDISGGGSYGLEFYWSHLFNTTYPEDALEVLVSDDDGATWTQVWYKIGVDLDSQDGATSTAPGTFVSSDIISLSAFGSPIKVRFNALSGFGPDLFVDDVMVFEVAYGDLDGTVTDLATSTPIEGAEIAVGSMTTTTGSDGTYSIPGLLVGDYTVTCTAMGYNPTSAMVTIVTDVTTTQDFAMTSPTMEIDPMEISVTIDPNTQATENIDITNNGDGSLGWSAQLELLTEGTDEVGDILVEINASAAAAETQMLGGEWDGTYFWTTGAGSAADPNYLYKFDVEGMLLETYEQPAAVTGWGIRDLAWDGTYLYGGNESQFYQIDPADGTFTLLFASTFGTIRALAWVPTENAFYTKSFGDPLYKFDIAGTVLETITVAEAASAYGAAWDDVNNLLYIFDQTGTPGTTFVEFDIETNTATGVTYQVPMLTGSTDQIAGGAFFATDLVIGKAVLGGVTQGTPDDMIFAMEMGEFATWVSIDPNSGDVDPGNFSAMDVNFDATDIVPGTVKTANIHFTSNPDVGMVTVPVTMVVGDQELGFIEGNITLDGDATYNIGDVTEVLVEAGPYMAYPDVDGNYSIEVYPGTYEAVATLYGYETQTVAEIAVASGATVSDVDMVMPATYGRVMGTVTDVDTGDPIEDAMVMLVDTEFITTTAADGTYEIIVDAGTYDVYVNHATYTPQTATDVEIMAQMDTEQDFALSYQLSCEFSVVLLDDYGDGWNGNTLTISVDGVVVLSNLGLATGFGPETFYFEVGTGANVTCDYVGTPGTWDYENSYFIYDNDENEVFADGVGGVAPVGGSFTATCIVFIYGDLAGTVTEMGTGTPIEGAEIMIDDMTGYSLSDGTYLIEGVMIGTWDVYCDAVGYSPEMATVEIFEELVTVQDFELGVPEFVVDPMSISIEIEPNAMADEVINIENPGNGPLDWSTTLNVMTDNGDDVGDIVLELNVSAAAAETQMLGGEWDGTNFWTTGGGSAADPNYLYKFDVDGNLLETYEQPAAVTGWGIRDLGWDGTYLYGGNESQFYQIDPADGTFTLLFSSTFGTIRALAWVPTENAFYTKSFGDPLYKFDIDGNVLETITVAEAGSAYGAAWDDVNNLLYIFDQTGTPGTTFVEFDVETNTATGVTYQVPMLTGSTDQIAGGAFFASNLISGKIVLGGVTQGTPDDMIFAMELGDFATWISIDPNAGSLDPMSNEDMDVHFDATGLLPGVYEAQIMFSTNPDVGSPVVDVTMTVVGLIPPTNLMADYVCTDVELDWTMPTGGDPDTWNVYRDGTLLGNVDVMEYTDPMVDPEMEYAYTVTAVYGGDESQPTLPTTITVPVPEDLEPVELVGLGNTPSAGYATLTWESPDACLAPDSYSIYRTDAGMIAEGITEMEYVDGPLTPGVKEYYVVAVYYFGESGASNYVYPVITTGIEDYDASMFQIFPNPANELINVKSPVKISRIHILNNNGQLVLDEEVNNMEYQINVSKYDVGIYFVKLETSEGVIVRKITVQ